MNYDAGAINSSAPLSVKVSHSARLHPGSVVKGRVVSDNGGGSYTISVAGQKIGVISRIALSPGSSFFARVETSGKTVILKLMPGDGRQAGGTRLSYSNFNPDNPEISALLKRLGLPVAIDSFRLLQFAMGMGIKPDECKLSKAFYNGRKEKGGNFIERSQTALLLEEKGINATDLAVEEVSDSFYGGADERKSNGRDAGNRENARRGDSGKKTLKDAVKDYFSSVDMAVQTNRMGALTLFNMVCAKKKDEPHWLVLPFEWDFCQFYGAIRVLLSPDKKSAQKVVINIQNKSKKYTFVLYFRNRELSAAKVSQELYEAVGFPLSFKEMAESFLGPGKVSVLSSQELEGFASEDGGIGVFEGEA